MYVVAGQCFSVDCKRKADCSWLKYKIQAGTRPQPFLLRGGVWEAELAVNTDGPEKTLTHRTRTVRVRATQYYVIAY
jgi:hypothetical protein